MIPNQLQLQQALQQTILSVSGWRKIFATNGNAESREASITPTDTYITALSAYTFGHYCNTKQAIAKPTLLLGQDSRPTGETLRAIIAQMFNLMAFTIQDAGIIALPELLATVQTDTGLDGFFYISASHNPAGYNGFKFGFNNGTLVGSTESAEIITLFKNFMANPPANFTALYNQIKLNLLVKANPKVKQHCFQRYQQFIGTVFNLKQNVSQPLSVIIDFNGSSRLCSIDTFLLESLGLKVYPMGNTLGQFNHRIVPEGEGLEPLRQALQEQYKTDKTCLFGYMPDCDGDRGNLVIINPETGKAETVDAQTTFALCVFSELTSLQHHNYPMDKVAVVCNDATSLRITAIAQLWGCKVFTCETGEANVIQRANQAREQGYTVRILGEGSNGGNITYPATVRDPLMTVLSLINLLHNKTISLYTLIKNLPAYTTTSAFENDALLITHHNSAYLRRNFKLIFEKEWPAIQQKLNILGVTQYQFIYYEGVHCCKGIGLDDIDLTQTGGQKVMFYNTQNKEQGFMWFRGSKTEPVTRIIVDLKGHRPELETSLKNILRTLLQRADT